MSKREQRIDEEAAALWRELHGEPLPTGCTGIDLIEMAMSTSTVAEYRRLHTPSLRDRNLVWPR
jgi:hypothetical protein